MILCIALMCLGSVPQQPPTTSILYFLMKDEIISAISPGLRGYTVLPSFSTGSPALGTHEIYVEAPLPRTARAPSISSGPVLQLSPTTSTPMYPSVAETADSSVPKSMRPLLARVHCAITTRSLPFSLIACLAPFTAVFISKRSCPVSMRSASAPPSIIPNACL